MATEDGILAAEDVEAGDVGIGADGTSVFVTVTEGVSVAVNDTDMPLGPAEDVSLGEAKIGVAFAAGADSD